MSFFFEKEYDEPNIYKQNIKEEISYNYEENIGTRILKYQMNPRQLVISKLKRELMKFDLENSEIIADLENIAKKIDQLIYLNPTYLAAALILFESLNLREHNFKMFTTDLWKNKSLRAYRYNRF